MTTCLFPLMQSMEKERNHSWICQCLSLLDPQQIVGSYLKYNFRQDLEGWKTEQIIISGALLIGLSQKTPELSHFPSIDIKSLDIFYWGVFHGTKMN